MLNARICFPSDYLGCSPLILVDNQLLQEEQTYTDSTSHRCKLIPVNLSSHNIKKMIVSSNTYFVLTQNKVYAWGINLHGQLGCMHTQPVLEPQEALGLENIIDIVAGISLHRCDVESV